MTEVTPLISIYSGWKTYQRMLTEVVAPLTRDQLELALAPRKWSVGRTVQHLIANRVWWFQLWLGEGKPELAQYLSWDPSGKAEPPTVTAPELVDGLAMTWAMIGDALARWTVGDLAENFPAPKSLSLEEQEMFGDAPRGWIIWHVLEHEIHHGGEISLVLGVNGLHGIYGEA
jgi:uncharacterized damage-inducible protein DinB